MNEEDDSSSEDNLEETVEEYKRRIVELLDNIRRRDLPPDDMKANDVELANAYATAPDVRGGLESGIQTIVELLDSVRQLDPMPDDKKNVILTNVYIRALRHYSQMKSAIANVDEVLCELEEAMAMRRADDSSLKSQ